VFGNQHVYKETFPSGDGTFGWIRDIDRFLNTSSLNNFSHVWFLAELSMSESGEVEVDVVEGNPRSSSRTGVEETPIRRFQKRLHRQNLSPYVTELVNDFGGDLSERKRQAIELLLSRLGVEEHEDLTLLHPDTVTNFVRENPGRELTFIHGLATCKFLADVLHIPNFVEHQAREWTPPDKMPTISLLLLHRHKLQCQDQKPLTQKRVRGRAVKGPQRRPGPAGGAPSHHQRTLWDFREKTHSFLLSTQTLNPTILQL